MIEIAKICVIIIQMNFFAFKQFFCAKKYLDHPDYNVSFDKIGFRCKSSAMIEIATSLLVLTRISGFVLFSSNSLFFLQTSFHLTGDSVLQEYEFKRLNKHKKKYEHKQKNNKNIVNPDNGQFPSTTITPPHLPGHFLSEALICLDFWCSSIHFLFRFLAPIILLGYFRDILRLGQVSFPPQIFCKTSFYNGRVFFTMGGFFCNGRYFF